MERFLRTRRREIAVGLAILLIGVVVVLLLATRTDENADEPGRRDTTTTTPAQTESRPSPAPEGEKARREEPEVARTATLLVQAREETDARTLCRVLGQQAPGTGLSAVQACARTAGVNLSLLPTSDEFSIEGALVITDLPSGARAGVRLAGGTGVSLRKVGGRWRVTGIRRSR